MEFNRSSAPFRPNTTATPSAGAAKDTTKNKRSFGGKHDWNIVAQVAILFASLIIVVSAIFLISRPDRNEFDYVNSDTYQALSVNDGIANGGQIFFGKITVLNSKQVVLTNVFYPQANSTGELFPFACTIAKPANQIILNRTQVSYWYNLQSDSKVKTAIESYAKENNNKIDCSKFTTEQSADEKAAADPTTNTPATEEKQTTTTP